MINKVIEDYGFSLSEKLSNQKYDVYVLRTKNREFTIQEVYNKLEPFGATFDLIARYSGSTRVVRLQNENSKTVVFLTKPESGMSKNISNAFVTEVAPIVGFLSKNQPETADELFQILKNTEFEKCNFLIGAKSIKTAYDNVQMFESSTKYHEKLENALGIMKYLNDLNAKKKIKKLYWSAYEKPSFVSKKSRGDIIVKFWNGDHCELSIKCGKDYTKEPHHNTYIKNVYESLNFHNRITRLRNKLFHSVYKFVGAKDENYDKPYTNDKLEMNDYLYKLEQTDPKFYNAMYNKALRIIKDDFIETLSLNLKNTKDWIVSDILKHDERLFIIKAVDGDTIVSKSLLDFNIQDSDVSFVEKCKQSFDIVLSTPNDQMTLHFSIRTNKGMYDHKLGQFYNLAVKFNGFTS